MTHICVRWALLNFSAICVPLKSLSTFPYLVKLDTYIKKIYFLKVVYS